MLILALLLTSAMIDRRPAPPPVLDARLLDGIKADIERVVREEFATSRAAIIDAARTRYWAGIVQGLAVGMVAGVAAARVAGHRPRDHP